MYDESGYPCGQGVVESCNLPGLRPGSRPQDKNLTHSLIADLLLIIHVYPNQYVQCAN